MRGRLVLSLLFTVCLWSFCDGKNLPQKAVVVLEGEIHGRIIFEQAAMHSPVKIRGVVYGLPVGLHAFHIHEGSELGERCQLVGPHFNPMGKSHGGPKDEDRHAGDFGNIKSVEGKESSRADISVISTMISLYEDRATNVLNRSIAIHSEKDDFSPSFKSPIITCGLILPEDAQQGQEVKKVHAQVDLPWKEIAPAYVSSIPLNIKSIPDDESLQLKSPLPTSNIWTVGQVYEYEYCGHVSTGMLSIGPARAGASISGSLIVEPVDESNINIALVKVKVKSFSEDVAADVHRADPGTQVPLVDADHVTRPVQFTMINGKVQNMSIGTDEPLWTVNLKRALAAQLQLQVDSSSWLFNRPTGDYFNQHTGYHALEGCPSGECRTWYHMSLVSVEQLNANPELLAVPELCQGLPVYEIVKQRDLDKCRAMSLYNFLSTPGFGCNVTNGAGCQAMLSHADTVRIVACGSADQLLIQRIKSKDQLTTKPVGYETEAIEGLTVQHLTLKAVHPAGILSQSARLATQVDSYTTLSYSFDRSMKSAGDLMAQPELDRVNPPHVMMESVERIVSEADRLLAEIVDHLDSDAHYADPSSSKVPEKVDMLRRSLAHLSYRDLQPWVTKVTDVQQQSSTAMQVVVDALVLSGTNPCVVLVRDLILNGTLTGNGAVQAVGVLAATVKTPTRQIFETLTDLLTSSVVSQDLQLKMTFALSLTNLAYRACINSSLSSTMYPKLAMGELCSAQDDWLQLRLLPWLTEQLNSADQAVEKVALLASLNNLGHEMILPSVLPYIAGCQPELAVRHAQDPEHEDDEDDDDRPMMGVADMVEKEIIDVELNKTVLRDNLLLRTSRTILSADPAVLDAASCNLIRTKAIFSLSTLSSAQPHKINSILIPIFLNQSEPTDVRLAAATLILARNPEQVFWSRLALSTWFESDNHVAHFIYTTISNLAQNPDPAFSDLTQRAESVLAMMKPIRWTSYVSSHYVKGVYQEGSRLGFLGRVIQFPGVDSIIPSNHYASLFLNIGPWFTKIAEYSVNPKHMDKMADLLRTWVDQFVGVGSRGDSRDGDLSADILKQLGMQMRLDSSAGAHPEMLVFVNLVENYQLLWDVDSEWLQERLRNLIRMQLLPGSRSVQVNHHKYVPLFDTWSRIPSSMGLAYDLVGKARLFYSVKAQLETNFQFSPSMVAKGTMELRPTFHLGLVNYMELETPFAGSIPTCGVDVDMHLSLPGQLRLNVAMETAKVETSWSFIAADKLRVANHAVTPFTTIRTLGDSTPALLTDQARPIMLLSKPHNVSDHFGGDLFGLNATFCRHADEGAMEMPHVFPKDWFGSLALASLPSTLRFRHSHLDIDLAESQTDLIKTYFSIESESELSEDKWRNAKAPPNVSLFSGDYGKSLKSDYVLQRDSGAWKSAKMGHLFRKLTAATIHSFDITTEFRSQSKPATPIRRFGTSVTYAVGDYAQNRSLTVLMEHQKQSRVSDDVLSKVLCLDLSTSTPRASVVRRENMAADDLTRTARLNVGFGQSCQDRNIDIRAKLVRVEDDLLASERVKLEEICREQEMLNQGISEECITVRRMGTVLNRGSIVIDYNEIPAELRNVTVKASNLLRRWLGSYLTDNQVDVLNKAGQIRIEAVYNWVRGSMDVRVFKPQSNSYYESIRLYPLAEVMLPVNPRVSSLGAVFGSPGLCLVDQQTVTTFDGVIYNASIAGCDQVLAQDCSGRYSMAVLGRHENGDKIVAVLLGKQRIELAPSSGNVSVNGKSVAIGTEVVLVRDYAQEILAEIRLTKDGFLEVDSPTHHVRVQCSAEEVIIRTSPLHRGRLCGLCGSASGNRLDDLVGPNKCPLPSSLMSAAYELSSSLCETCKSDSEISLLQTVNQACQQERSARFNPKKPVVQKQNQARSSTKSITKDSDSCTVFRNKMIHRGKHICFSTLAVAKCNPGCVASKYSTKKLGFHCMKRNPMSEQLHQDMHTRPLNELIGADVKTSQYLNVPVECAPATAYPEASVADFAVPNVDIPASVISAMQL